MPPLDAVSTTVPPGVIQTRASGSNLGRAVRGITARAVGVYLLLLAVAACGEAVFVVRDANDARDLLLAALARFAGLVAQMTPAIVLVAIADSCVAGSRRRRLNAIVLAILAGTIAGMTLRWSLASVLDLVYEDPKHSHLRGSPLALAAYFTMNGINAAIGALFYLSAARASEAGRRMHDARLARIALERRADETRLQLLQAQIEPHFLFNTLATLRRLYETDPAAAGVMLRDLMRYLDMSLPQIRTGSVSLGSEIALCRAYLNVQKVRMGGRLDVEIDVPATLESMPFPPMLLVTLVENAVKHGLAPLPEGGRVAISAAVDRGQLRIRIDDTGRGLGESMGSGVGLANVRERLATQFGERGGLTLRNNRPKGASVTIEMPAMAST